MLLFAGVVSCWHVAPVATVRRADEAGAAHQIWRGEGTLFSLEPAGVCFFSVAQRYARGSTLMPCYRLSPGRLAVLGTRTPSNGFLSKKTSESIVAVHFYSGG